MAEFSCRAGAGLECVCAVCGERGEGLAHLRAQRRGSHRDARPPGLGPLGRVGGARGRCGGGSPGGQGADPGGGAGTGSRAGCRLGPAGLTPGSRTSSRRRGVRGGSLRSGHRGLCEAPAAPSLPGRRERRGAGPAPHGLHAAGGAGGGPGERPPPAPSPVARSPGAAPGSARDHAAGRAPGAAAELGHHERTQGADVPLRGLRETPDPEEAVRSMPGRCWCFCSARGL
nr:collagen alpha-1(I) chain-like [Caretta caretta]